MSCGCARNRPLPEGNPKGQTDKAQSDLAIQVLRELAEKFRAKSRLAKNNAEFFRRHRGMAPGSEVEERTYEHAAIEADLKADELAEIGVTCQPEQKEGGQG